MADTRSFFGIAAMLEFFERFHLLFKPGSHSKPDLFLLLHKHSGDFKFLPAGEEKTLFANNAKIRFNSIEKVVQLQVYEPKAVNVFKALPDASPTFRVKGDMCYVVDSNIADFVATQMRVPDLNFFFTRTISYEPPKPTHEQAAQHVIEAEAWKGSYQHYCNIRDPLFAAFVWQPFRRFDKIDPYNVLIFSRNCTNGFAIKKRMHMTYEANTLGLSSNTFYIFLSGDIAEKVDGFVGAATLFLGKCTEDHISEYVKQRLSDSNANASAHVDSDAE